jgi:hypothetical protein
MTEKRKESEPPKGRPLALDPLGKSASQTEPAFIARPASAPVYYGFEILSGVVVRKADDQLRFAVRPLHCSIFSTRHDVVPVA